MSFPNRRPWPVTQVPESLTQGLSLLPVEVWCNEQAYFAIYQNEDQVRQIVPNLTRLAELGPRDVVVTAPGQDVDFVSRYFWPANGGAEDPVTGSIHAGLTPFWSDRLHKSELQAVQASQRGGHLSCSIKGDRVFVAGSAVLYLEGRIHRR